MVTTVSPVYGAILILTQVIVDRGVTTKRTIRVPIERRTDFKVDSKKPDLTIVDFVPWGLKFETNSTLVSTRRVSVTPPSVSVPLSSHVLKYFRESWTSREFVLLSF